MVVTSSVESDNGERTPEVRVRMLMKELRDAVDPHRIYDTLRRDGSVCSDGLGSWLILGRGEAEVALSDWHVIDQAWMKRNRPEWLESSLRNTLNKTMLNTNDPVHGDLRSHQAPPLAARRVARMRPMVRGVVEEALTAFHGRLIDGSTDFTDTAGLIPVTVVASLLGIPLGDVPRLVQLGERVAAGQDLSVSPSIQRSADEASEEIMAYLARNDPEQGVLAQACSHAGDSAFAGMAAYLVAGTVTTTSMLCHLLLYWLSYRPDISSVGAREAVVEEVLRLEPPANVISRHVPEDCWLGGQFLRADQIAHIMIGAVNRDPAYFDDPHAFRPDRRQQGVVFGYGTHYCVGAALARLQGEVFLESLAQHGAGWKMDGQTEHAKRNNLRHIERLSISLRAVSSAVSRSSR